MANSFHADILYDYLVEGLSQDKIAARHGCSQSDVSTIVRKEYGLNRGNKKWGKGAANQKGKYSFLSYDDICAFIDSGSRDLDGWLNGNGGYSDDYDDGYDDDYDDGYDDDYDDDYDDGYSGYNSQNNSNSNSYNSGYNNGGYQADSYNQPTQGTNGRRVRYVNPDDYDDNGNYRGSKGSMDGRIVLLVLGILILACGWFVNKYSGSTGAIGENISLLWHSDYLWWGIVTGGIFGFLKYQSCKNLGEVFTTCGTWAWAGLGYIIGAVVFFVNYGLIIPALMLAALGAVLIFAGYKLFF